MRRYGILANPGASVTEGEKVPEAAIADLLAAADLKPSWHQAYWYLGKAYRAQGRLGEAVERFDKAVEIVERTRTAIRPEDLVLLYRQRTGLHYLHKDFDLAREDLEKAIAVLPAGSRAYPGGSPEPEQGNAGSGQRQFEEAVTAYDAALSIRPEFREVHRWRGMATLEMRRYDEAIRSFDRCLAEGERMAEVFRARDWHGRRSGVTPRPLKTTPRYWYSIPRMLRHGASAVGHTWRPMPGAGPARFRRGITPPAHERGRPQRPRARHARLDHCTRRSRTLNRHCSTDRKAPECSGTPLASSPR